MVLFLLDFSSAQNSCVLLTLKSKLHLVSIENTVVKNKRENITRHSLATSERTNKKGNCVFYCIVVLSNFVLFICVIIALSIRGIHFFRQMCVKAQQNTFFIFYQFFTQQFSLCFASELRFFKILHPICIVAMNQKKLIH
jgi:hypothetical protein